MRGLHFKGVGHSGPARGVLTGCAAEGMEVGAEHKIVPFAQRNPQATQGSFDPGPLSNTATVRGEVHQLTHEEEVLSQMLELRALYMLQTAAHHPNDLHPVVSC